MYSPIGVYVILEGGGVRGVCIYIGGELVGGCLCTRIKAIKANRLLKRLTRARGWGVGAAVVVGGVWLGGGLLGWGTRRRA